MEKWIMRILLFVFGGTALLGLLMGMVDMRVLAAIYKSYLGWALIGAVVIGVLTFIDTRLRK
jgi:hypothetical protein